MTTLHIQRQGSRLELRVTGSGPPDPDLLTILLRRRPAAALPFTLYQDGRDLLFLYEVQGLLSLGHWLSRQGAQASAKAILRETLLAVLAVWDACLSLDSRLLVPGLVFVDPATGRVYLLSLPLAPAKAAGSLLPLLQRLSAHGDFTAEESARLQTDLTADRYQEALQRLTPPGQERVREASFSWRACPQKLIGRLRDTVSDLHQQLRRQLLADRELEITEPLEQKASFRIAMLSQGLPGTRAEEEGIKAFILVDEYLIGRDRRKVDFYLDDENAGRVHARILRRRDLFFLEDLGSKNGTVLDGQRLQKYREVLLPDHCKIQFGRVVLYFTADAS